MVTRFMDMCSGGGIKVKPYEYILIEAPEEKAREIFERLFDRDPSYVTCDCCGEDYGVREHPTVAHATAFDRHCRWDETLRDWVEEPDTWYSRTTLVTVEEYLQRPDVLFLRAPDFTLPG